MIGINKLSLVGAESSSDLFNVVYRFEVLAGLAGGHIHKIKLKIQRIF